MANYVLKQKVLKQISSATQEGLCTRL